MAILFTKSKLLIVLSGILFAVSIIWAQFYLAWICLVPFFLAVGYQSKRKNFLSGMLLGGVFSAVLLYWMIELVGNFAGSWKYGIAIYFVAVVISMVHFGLVASGIKFLVKSEQSVWLNGIAVASVWILFEWALSSISPGMPWFGLFRLSNAVLENIYAIQAAELGGAYLISFIIVLANYLFAHYLSRKSWKMLYVPLLFVAAYMSCGYLIFSVFNSRTSVENPITVAIICDNTLPDNKWDENSAPQLVQKLLSLNSIASNAKPDIVLWSESVVPWTYKEDDDFVKEILKANSFSTHILGMTTDISDKEIFNSAYCLQPDGTLIGRYDKHYPVSLAEKPVANISLPFAGSNQHRYEKEGIGTQLLNTPYSAAGALICNDGTVPGSTIKSVTNGASFLVSLSNDAWFSHVPFLVKQHFLNTKLRAVEVRRDMVINCNMGISATVKASGEVNLVEASNFADVNITSVQKNKYLTIYSILPQLLICLLGVIIAIFTLTICFLKKH